MFIIYPLGENAKNELNNLGSQFLAEHNTFLGSFYEEVNKDKFFPIIFFDMADVDVSTLDFSQFHIVLCKTQGKKDLSSLRINNPVFNVSDKRSLALTIEILNLSLFSNFLFMHFLDMREVLSGAKKTVTTEKTITFTDVDDLLYQSRYFSETLKEFNTTSYNIMVNFVGSYSVRGLELEVDEVMMNIFVDKNRDNIVMASSNFGFDKRLPEKTMRIILTIACL